MYDEATARRILEETVRVTAEYADDGEAVVGFDTNDAALDGTYVVDNDDYCRNFSNRWHPQITPLTYFALI